MSKRKIFFITLASAAVLLAVTALILDKSGYLVRALKPEVVRALSVATGRPVQVESVEGGIFGSIAIKGLSLGRAAKPQKVDASVTVEKAVVTFSLWDFFIKHKAASESLRRLEFQAPVIRLEILNFGEAQGQTAALDLTRTSSDLGSILASLPLPPVETLIEGGRLELVTRVETGQEPPSLLMNKIQASLKFYKEQGKAHLELSAAAYGGSLKSRADFSPSTRAGTGELILNSVELAQLGALPSLEPLKRFASGQLQGRLKLKLVPQETNQWMPGLSVSGGLELKTGQDSSMEITLRERQASLVLHKGLGRMEADGSLRNVSGSTILDFKGRFSRFPLTTPSGVIDGVFTISGSLQQPLAQAQFNCQELKFGQEKISNVRVGLDINDHRADVSGSFKWRNYNSLSVSAQAGFDEKKFEIFEFVLRDAARSQQLARGSAWLNFYGNQGIQGSFEIGPVESGDLQQAYALPPRLRGPVSARLVLSGTLGAPEISVKVAGPGITTKDGQAFGLSSELQVKEGVLSLKRLEARDKEVSATGRWHLAEDSRIEIRLKNAQIPALAALGMEPGSAKPLTGVLDGLVILGWGGHYDVDLKASSLELGAFVSSSASLKASIAARSWNIQELMAIQAGGGKLHGSASFDPQGNGEARLNLKFKDWKIFKHGPYSAKVEVSGAKPGVLKNWFRRATNLAGGVSSGQEQEIGGVFSVSEFSTSSTALPSLTGHWGWFERKEFELQDLSWGPGISAQAVYKKDGTWNARVDLKDADVTPVAILLNLGKAAFTQRLSAQFEGASAGTADSRHRGDAGFSFKMGSQLSGELQKFTREDGSARWQGTASVKSLELKKALELAAWSGVEGFADASRAVAGNLNADVQWDSALALPLSFSAGVGNFGIARDDPWGDLVVRGHASRQGLHLDLLDLGVSKSRLQLHDVDLKKTEQGAWELDGDFVCNDFPDKAFFRFGGQGSLHLKAAKEDTQIEARWREFKVNLATFEAGAARLSWKDRQLEVDDLSEESKYHAVLKIPQKGEAELESLNASLANNASLEAHHGLDEEGKRRLEISGRGVDLGLLARVLDWKLSLGGLVYGNAVLRGADSSQGHMRLLVSAKIENGNLEGFPFDLATGSVRLEQGRLDLKPLGEPVRIVRRNRYEAEVEGMVPLNTDKQELLSMDARLLSGNMGLFDFIDIVDSGSGTVTAQVKVRGTARYPEYSGNFEVRGGSLKFKRLLAPATDIQAAISVESNKLDLTRLNAQMGSAGQRLYVEHGPFGDAVLTFDQWILAGLNLKFVNGKAGIHLVSNDRYEFINGDVILDKEKDPFSGLEKGLVLGGTWDDPTLQGKISISNATITYPIIRSDTPAPGSSGFSDRLQWDVVVKPGNKVVFANSVSRVELQSDEKGVRLYGPGRDITLEGRIRPLRGKLTFYSSDFQIDDSHDNYVDFLGNQPPYLSLWATKMARSAQGFDTPINLTISGSLGNVGMGFSSPNKDLTDAQLNSMAGLGVDVTGSGGFDQVVGTFAGKFLMRKLSDKFKGARGLDLTLRAPGLVRMATGNNSSASSQTITVDAAGNTQAGRDIGEVGVGSYLAGSKYYGTAGVVVKEGLGGNADTSLKLGVERNLGSGWKGEVSRESEDTRVLFKTQNNLENYDPRKRREALAQKRLTKRSTPTLTPTPVSASRPTWVPEDDK